MSAYLALTRTYLQLTIRDRAALFYTLIMPLTFFFIFAQLNHAERGTAPMVVNMVLTIGILGTGLFGAGMRATADRETNILRRFKVAPITPAPILIASMVVGLLNYLPVYALILLLANRMYHMPMPRNLISVTLFVIAGVLAFRAIGLIVASIANSMQESQILIQSLYMPMLFLSGATIPMTIMPEWVQIASQFLPATHLFAGMQSVLGSGETLAKNLTAFGALALTVVVGLFIGIRLFRWEKEEKIAGRSKLAVLVVLLPFIVMGVWQAYSKESIARNKRFDRDLGRRITYLVKNARIFTGDGSVIDRGSVLMRDGKIDEIFAGQAPKAEDLKAVEIDGAGKTLMPGLIDAHVHVGAPGGFWKNASDYPAKWPTRVLKAYLYSGVLAVKSAGDTLPSLLESRKLVDAGEELGTELFVSGPLFTTVGGHGTEYLKGEWLNRMPESARKMMADEFVRTPKTADEARAQVIELKRRGVDAIKGVLEAGAPGMAFNRMDVSILRAVVEEAHRQGLPVSIHTGDVQDVKDAIAMGVESIEHGSMRQDIPNDVFQRMKQAGVAYDPTLTVVEGLIAFARRSPEPLERSLVQQVGPRKLIEDTRTILASKSGETIGQHEDRIEAFKAVSVGNLQAAFRNGVTLVAGTDAGNPLTFHGPAVHRELQLWVEAGIPAAVALQAATLNNARLLRADKRLGLIRKGFEANVVLVDGDPTRDVSATERISAILLKGERIHRNELFEDEK
jgi:imidazolonepropionase-like amidohydrolase/ABC-type multidrug transport system permease subunit